MYGREEMGTIMNLVGLEDMERGGWPCMPCGHRNEKAVGDKCMPKIQSSCNQL